MRYQILDFIQKQQRPVTTPEIICKFKMPSMRIYGELNTLKKDGLLEETTIEQALEGGK